MKVTLESTDKIGEFKGIPVRIWQGKTEGGVECYAIIAMIAHHTDDNARAVEFERDLQKHTPASDRAFEAFELRYFVD